MGERGGERCASSTSTRKGDQSPPLWSVMVAVVVWVWTSAWTVTEGPGATGGAGSLAVAAVAVTAGATVSPVVVPWSALVTGGECSFRLAFKKASVSRRVSAFSLRPRLRLAQAEAT